MGAEEEYIKASRYDIKANRHNFQVFHNRLSTQPWLALTLALFMGFLAVCGFYNLFDSPQWSRHPWMGWSIGAIALLPACYFLVCAVAGVLAFFTGKDRSKE
jgi:hypothetical protein